MYLEQFNNAPYKHWGKDISKYTWSLVRISAEVVVGAHDYLIITMPLRLQGWSALYREALWCRYALLFSSKEKKVAPFIKRICPDHLTHVVIWTDCRKASFGALSWWCRGSLFLGLFLGRQGSIVSSSSISLEIIQFVPTAIQDE